MKNYVLNLSMYTNVFIINISSSDDAGKIRVYYYKFKNTLPCAQVNKKRSKTYI